MKLIFEERIHVGEIGPFYGVTLETRAEYDPARRILFVQLSAWSSCERLDAEEWSNKRRVFDWSGKSEAQAIREVVGIADRWQIVVRQLALNTVVEQAS